MVRRTGRGETTSPGRDDARGAGSTAPGGRTASFPCGPGAGAGAAGAWRSGAREQFGAEHGDRGTVGCPAASFATGGRASEPAVGLALRMTT